MVFSVSLVPIYVKHWWCEMISDVEVIVSGFYYVISPYICETLVV